MKEQQPSPEVELYNRMMEIRWLLTNAKPAERSELSRRYAVTITELEKVMAYYYLFVCQASL